MKLTTLENRFYRQVLNPIGMMDSLFNHDVPGNDCTNLVLSYLFSSQVLKTSQLAKPVIY